VIGNSAALQRHDGFSNVSALEGAWLAAPTDVDVGVN
jgi:hypothetical protein